MPTATLTSKGQTTIPKEVRDALHLQEGDEIEFILLNEGEAVLKPSTLDAKHLKGILGREGSRPVSPVSIEDMNAVIKNRFKARPHS